MKQLIKLPSCGQELDISNAQRKLALSMLLTDYHIEVINSFLQVISLGETEAIPRDNF